MTASMKNKKNTLTSLDGTLQETMHSIIKLHNMEKAYTCYQIQRKWKSIVGTVIASNTYPARLTGTLLYIEYSEPIWGEQLRIYRDDIIEKINSRIGKNTVVKITARHTAVLKKTTCGGENTKLKKEKQPDPDCFKDINISPERLKEIDEQLSMISNATARDALKRLYMTVMKNEEHDTREHANGTS